MRINVEKACFSGLSVVIQERWNGSRLLTALRFPKLSPLQTNLPVTGHIDIGASAKVGLSRGVQLGRALLLRISIDRLRRQLPSPLASHRSGPVTTTFGDNRSHVRLPRLVCFGSIRTNATLDFNESNPAYAL
jgi:hypothetical protein